MPDAPSATTINLRPLALRREDAAAILGVSVSSFDRSARSGELGPVPLKRFGCALYIAEELRAWVEAGMPRREVWAAHREKENRLKLTA